jgi:hypothetical protein
VATTPAELCNVALGRIGHRQFIDSLNEAVAAAEACAVSYPFSRDLVLAAFPWPFATRRARLAEVADQARSGWGYVYALPVDLIAVRYLYNAANIGVLATADKRTPYALEGSPMDPAAGYGRRVLLTDQAGAELLYTARVETVALYPPAFQDALAWHLASELALSLAVKPQLGIAALGHYERALARAAALELRQGQDGPMGESEFIRERT